MRRILLLLLLSLTSSAYCQPASILIIESYHKEFPWDKSFNRGIISTVGNDHQYHHFYMDTKRISANEFNAKAELAWLEYQQLKPDIVVLADDNAINLLSAKFALTATPVVFLGLNSNPRDYGLNTYDNFTGVLERPLFKRSILLAEQTAPLNKKNNILVLFDDGATSRTAVASISGRERNIQIGNSNIDIKLTRYISDWREQVLSSKANGYDLLFIGLYHTLINSNEQHIPPRDVINWTNHNAPLPHFGFWDFSINEQGNIGGYVLDGYKHGELAGSLILKIISGKQPSDLPYVVDRHGRFLFSQAGVKKWKLNITKELNKKADWTN